MKRQYANLFYIVLAENVLSVKNNTIELPNEVSLDMFLAENDIELNEVQSKSGANDFFKQSIQAITLSVSEAFRMRYRKAKVVVQLKTTDGEKLVIGSPDVPVRVKIDSTLNVDKWQFYCNSPKPVIK